MNLRKIKILLFILFIGHSSFSRAQEQKEKNQPEEKPVHISYQLTLDLCQKEISTLDGRLECIWSTKKIIQNPFKVIMTICQKGMKKDVLKAIKCFKAAAEILAEQEILGAIADYEKRHPDLTFEEEIQNKNEFLTKIFKNRI
jgi:hypothetical protein